MASGDIYDDAYFIHGKRIGISLYENYRWLPFLTIPMVRMMIEHLDIARDDRILDFGCARGYVVRAFRELGYSAWGYDISRWAMENADPVAAPYLLPRDGDGPARSVAFDWVIAKDVLEHIQQAGTTVLRLQSMARKGVFAVVPLSLVDNCDYVISDYERDVTHVQRLSLGRWAAMFMRPGWAIDARYRVPGIKDAWYRDGWERGNGFVTALRIGG